VDTARNAYAGRVTFVLPQEVHRDIRAMRTSGAATESQMTVMVCLVALGILMLLAGGPSEFMTRCERALQGVAETAHQAWLKAGS
jgi:hypothetical protein